MRGVTPGYGRENPDVMSALSGYQSPYASAPGTSGTVGYQSPGNLNLSTPWDEYTKLHSSKRKWYRQYRNWADAWRTYTQQALGMGGRDALDPLAQLQRQLGEYIDPARIGQIFSQNYDFDPMVGAQQQALGSALQQRAAAMGLGGAFGGVMEEAHRARSSMASQSLAAYRPQAWQAQQEIQGHTSQLLDALARAEFEAEAATEAAGRNA